MSPRAETGRRAALAVPALALLALAATGAAAASPELGATVPDLSLTGLDDVERTLSQRDGPTVLVFFRGVW